MDVTASWTRVRIFSPTLRLWGGCEKLFTTISGGSPPLPQGYLRTGHCDGMVKQTRPGCGGVPKLDRETQIASKPCVDSLLFPHLETQQSLCRSPGNFTQGWETYSVANTPSIINSPVLSFLPCNHSTRQTETQPVGRDPPLPCGNVTHTYLPLQDTLDLLDSTNLQQGDVLRIQN